MLPIDTFDRSFERYADKPALVDDRGTVTFGQLGETSVAVARGLEALGVTETAVVGIYSPNRGRVFEIVTGIWRRGACWNPISATNVPESNHDLLRRAGTSVVFVDESYFDLVAGLRRAVPGLTLVSMGEAGPCDIGWSDFLTEGRDFPAWQTSQGNPDQRTMIIGTGGTTGQPKLVVETVRVWNAMMRVFETSMPNDENSRQLVTAPATHAAGIVALLAAAQGQTVYFHNGFHAPNVLDAIERDRITTLFLPPTAFYDLIEEQLRRPRDVSAVESLLVAAAPISPARLAQGAELFGWSVSQCFGQVEAPMFVTFQTPEDIRRAVEDGDEDLLRSCGRVTEVAAVSIQDDDGTILDYGESGEICVRGELVSQEYLGNPEATAQTHRGGWLHTGDVGVLSASGFLSIRDRIKDMIITGGFNVYAAEVEAALLRHPKVSRAAVIGVPDDRWGEKVTAVIVAEDDFADADALIAFAKEQVGSVQAPKEIRWVKSLPQTPVGKINKVALRERV
jgi:fatty-acyl-CoA synthase